MSDKPKPTFVLVPRKLIVVATVAYICMMALTAASIQWANYVDMRSNQRWCGIVTLFNETYKDIPPPTELGKKFAVEFIHLRDDFKCK
jgi:hypothetical protein